MKGVYLFSNPTNYYNDIASAHICAITTRMCDRVLTIKPNVYTGMGYTGELGAISTWTEYLRAAGFLPVELGWARNRSGARITAEAARN